MSREFVGREVHPSTVVEMTKGHTLERFGVKGVDSFTRIGGFSQHS